MAASARSCRGSDGASGSTSRASSSRSGAPRARAPRSSPRRARRPVRAGASPRRGSSRTRRSANGRRGRRGAPGPRLARTPTPSARASSRGRDSSGVSSKPTRATDEGAPWSRVGRICSAASAASRASTRSRRATSPSRLPWKQTTTTLRAGWKPRWKGMMVSSSAGPDSEIFGMHRASPPPSARRQARRLACGRTPLAPRRCGSRWLRTAGRAERRTTCQSTRATPVDPFSAPDACAPTRGRSRSSPAGRPRAAGRGPRDRARVSGPRAGGRHRSGRLRSHRPSAPGRRTLSRDGRDGRTRTPWPASHAMKRSVSSKNALIAQRDDDGVVGGADDREDRLGQQVDRGRDVGDRPGDEPEPLEGRTGIRPLDGGSARGVARPAPARGCSVRRAAWRRARPMRRLLPS